MERESEAEEVEKSECQEEVNRGRERSQGLQSKKGER